MCRQDPRPVQALDSLGLDAPFRAPGQAPGGLPAALMPAGWDFLPFAAWPMGRGEKRLGEAVWSGSPPFGEHEAEQRAKPLDLKTAEHVMYEIMPLLISGDPAGSDPDRQKNPPPWFRLYAPLFKEWHVVVHGTATVKGRERLQGEALQARIESAFTMTKPVLALLARRGGGKWQKLLRQSFYAPVAKFELEAIKTIRPERRAPEVPPITFALRPPQQVSPTQFFNFVAEFKSEPIPLQERIGGAQVGWVKPGFVYQGSKQDERTVLWCGSMGVLFLRNGTIFAQSGAGFSHDIIMGAFVVGAQNAMGSMIMSQLMVELALSFTPWGAVWDVVSAMRAASERDWKGMLLSAFGPSFQFAAKVRSFKAVARGAMISRKFAKSIAQQGLKAISRGTYVANGKLLRGFWIVGEGAAGDARNFRFLDEASETIHSVPSDKARNYIVCSQCRVPPSALNLAREAEVRDIMEDLLASPSYAAAGGKIAIKPKLIEDVVSAYGSDGAQVANDIFTAFDGGSDAARTASDCLQLAKTLSKVKSRHPRFRQIAVYQDAIDIFADLAAHPQTARGAMFELQWAARHVSEIAAMGVPIYRKGWKGVGKGLDILTKKGAAIELKNYNFTHQIYSDDPARSVSRIVNQAKLRLAYKEPAVTEVKFIFDSGTAMPRPFRRMLEEEFAALTSSSGRSISFAFWPPT